MGILGYTRGYNGYAWGIRGVQGFIGYSRDIISGLTWRIYRLLYLLFMLRP